MIRLMQIYELKDEDSYQEICNMFEKYRLVKIQNNYINLYDNPSFAEKLEKITNLPVVNAMLSNNQYKKMMSYTLV